MGQVIMNGCGEREHATRRFIDESGGCCTAALHLVGHHASIRTHARRRSVTLILWLWRHQWGCVTQVAAVLIKRGLSWLTKDNGSISDSGIWKHFCTACNILPSLFSWLESFSIIGHHCISSIILKNQLFIIHSCQCVGASSSFKK